MIGNNIFINCKDLDFVTDNYLTGCIEVVIQEINRKSPKE